MQNRKLFELSENIEEDIANMSDKTKKLIDEGVKDIEKWMKSQPHLPEIMDKNTIRLLFNYSKCSFEETKRKIDYYYTVRTKWLDLYENINPKLPQMKSVRDAVYWLPLPKQSKKFCRVFVAKIRDINFADDIDYRDFNGHFINIYELILKEDYHMGQIFIFDLSQIKKEFLRKFSFGILQKMSTMCYEVFHIHIEGIYILNAPPFIDSFYTFLKTMLKPKIFERMHFCKSNEDLLKSFPKEMLPSDYGGEEKSLEELNGMLKDKFLEYEEFFNNLDNMKVDESLRPAKLENDEFLGFYGNFKKLDVD